MLLAEKYILKWTYFFTLRSGSVFKTTSSVFGASLRTFTQTKTSVLSALFWKNKNWADFLCDKPWHGDTDGYTDRQTDRQTGTDVRPDLCARHYWCPQAAAAPQNIYLELKLPFNGKSEIHLTHYWIYIDNFWHYAKITDHKHHGRRQFRRKELRRSDV